MATKVLLKANSLQHLGGCAPRPPAMWPLHFSIHCYGRVCVCVCVCVRACARADVLLLLYTLRQSVTTITLWQSLNHFTTITSTITLRQSLYDFTTITLRQSSQSLNQSLYDNQFVVVGVLLCVSGCVWCGSVCRNARGNALRHVVAPFDCYQYSDFRQSCKNHWRMRVKYAQLAPPILFEERWVHTLLAVNRTDLQPIATTWDGV